MRTPQAPAARATVSGDVVERLRRDILDGAHPSGSRLKVGVLARRYGVSPMPVREAIRILDAEGLVETSPRRGTRVVTVDDAFIRNVYDMREALEGMLAARCAQRAGRAEVGTVRSIIADHVAAMEGGDMIAVIELDRRLHLTIADVAQNPQARQALTIGRGLIEALRVRVDFSPARRADVVREHRMLADAIDAGDSRTAELVARIHVIGARDDLLARMARTGP